MIDGTAELPVQGPGAAAKIIQEIGERPDPSAGGVGKRSALVKWRMLPCQLPQEVSSKTESVLAADQAHGVLVLPVIGKSELRYVGGNSKSGQPVSQAPVIRQVQMERIRSHPLKIKTNAAIVEPEFVRHPRVDHIGVGKRTRHG